MSSIEGKFEGRYGGELVVETLKNFGITTIFTMCGGHISPILVASKQLGIKLVDTRHEATTVFAADALARLSGIPGVAVVTAGPGLTNTITAVKNAQLAQSPVILIGGATVTQLKGRGSLQDIDQHALLKPHCKWVKTVKKVRDIPKILEKAYVKCRSDVPGPVFIEIPLDILYPEKYMRQLYFDYQPSATKKKSLYKTIETKYLTYHLNKIFKGKDETLIPQTPKIIQKRTSEQIISKVAERINTAKKPLLLIGSQVLSNPDSIKDIQNALNKINVPIYFQSTARGLLEKNPIVYRHKRRQAIREADLVILIGVPKDFRLNFGWMIRKSTFLVTVNLDKKEIKKNRKPKIGINVDPQLFILDLANQVNDNRQIWEEWYKVLRGRDNEREKEIIEQEQEKMENVNPIHLCRQLNDSLDDQSIIVADGGDFVATAAYTVQPKKPLSWLDPGPFGTLGVGAGFALASKIHRPESEVWIIFGDGSVGYSLAEYDTFIRHKIPVIALVGNDAGWTQVERIQEEVFQENVATQLGFVSYEKVVQGFGAEGLLIKESSEIKPTLKRAKELAKAGKPVLINVLIGKTEFRKGSISM
ncbi:MAG: thiamine pyrophosphate-binding protein [Candidatus Hodarchaeales archaeon]